MTFNNMNMELPNDIEVSYHRVNPVIMSNKTKEEIWNTLINAIENDTDVIKYKKNWSISILSVIEAEELTFNINLYNSENLIKIDFTLKSGCEFTFISKIRDIRNKCKNIDMDYKIFDLMENYNDTFLINEQIDKNEINTILKEILNYLDVTLIYELTRYLKDICRNLKNDTLKNLLSNNENELHELYELFKKTIMKMLKCEDADIVRFGLYIIYKKEFKEELLEWEELKETLTKIIITSPKITTKNQANLLFNMLY